MSTTTWILLRLRRDAGWLLLEYSDSLGRGFAEAIVTVDAVPQSVLGHVKELTAGPSPLAVFLDPQWMHRSTDGVPAEHRVEKDEPLAILCGLAARFGETARPVRIVTFLPGHWPERVPFFLPLNVLTVGSVTAWFDEAIRSRDWLVEVRSEDAGLTTTGNWVSELLKRNWLGTETDMMICQEADLAKLSLALRITRHRPRLLVALTEGDSARAQKDSRNLPVGTSLLALPFGGDLGTPSETLVELMGSFAHDRPLHEFGRYLNDRDFTRRRPVRLFSKPEALDCLRVSHALSAMTEEILSLPSTATSAGIETLRGTAASHVLADTLVTRRPSLSIRSMHGPAGRASSTAYGGAFFDDAVTTVTGFTREYDGLLPMSQMRRELKMEQTAQVQVRRATAAAFRDSGLRRAYISRQTRVVDVTMRRLSRAGIAGTFVQSDQSLVAQARYRVRVQVGRRSQVSIVSGNVPPIDLLLPPHEEGCGHVLRVAFYSDDFELLSPLVQRLELPEVGASSPVQFDISPRRVQQDARARIAVYYDLPPDGDGKATRNHLVQTFLLTARVRASESRYFETKVVDVAPEFSLNARFSQLEQLQSRLVSLALNDGPDGHKLMMKRGGDALPVDFTEGQLGESLKNIRSTLDWISRNDDRSGPRFPADQAEGKAEDFNQAIWRLASSGHSVYGELFGSAVRTPLEAALNEIAQQHDKLIQTVYLTRNYAFPWTSIYDLDLPPDVVGGPVPTICDGFRRKKPDGSPLSCGECLGNCLHPDKREAVCVYGFWGTRHQVEQLTIDTGENSPVLRPVGPGALAFSMGITGTFVNQIPSDLDAKLKDTARRIPDDEDFVPALWTDRRPAVLLLVGHYKSADVAGEPRGPRLTLPGKRFLLPDDILRQRQMHPKDWADPRSVILLAACSGGVVDITSARNFVNVFTGVGAGAVIGPEVIIYEGVARRFAVEISEALVAGRSVGAAVLDFRRGLLQNLNPLGLVFTAYGFADLAAALAAP